MKSIAPKSLLILVAAFVVAVSSVAHASQPFDAKAFEAAQNADKTILVDVFASWCATCAKQEPIIKGAEAENPSLTVFVVDFDTDKEALRRLRVQYQSTLIVFKGKNEVARSTGETDPVAIGTLIRKGF